MLDKEAVRRVVQAVYDHARYFSEGPVGVEQATNAILRLDRAPRTLHEAALLVACTYCGRTPGNWCVQRGSTDPARHAHPSRLRRALDERGDDW